MAIHGLNCMFLCEALDQPQLVPLRTREGWLADSVHVMDGNFTVMEDRQALVNVVLGLYALNLMLRATRGQDEEDSTRLADIAAVIERHHESVFPADLFKGFEWHLAAKLQRISSGTTSHQLDQLVQACSEFARIAGKPVSPEAIARASFSIAGQSTRATTLARHSFPSLTGLVDLAREEVTEAATEAAATVVEMVVAKEVG